MVQVPCLLIPFVAYSHFAKDYPYVISEKDSSGRKWEVLHFILARLIL